MGRWDPTEGWPEASFAPCIGQKVCVERCVCVCVCVYVGGVSSVYYTLGHSPFLRPLVLTSASARRPQIHLLWNGKRNLYCFWTF